MYYETFYINDTFGFEAFYQTFRAFPARILLEIGGNNFGSKRLLKISSLSGILPRGGHLQSPSMFWCRWYEDPPRPLD